MIQTDTGLYKTIAPEYVRVQSVNSVEYFLVDKYSDLINWICTPFFQEKNLPATHIYQNFLWTFRISLSHLHL
jgi:hypothetical protein